MTKFILPFLFVVFTCAAWYKNAHTSSPAAAASVADTQDNCLQLSGGRIYGAGGPCGPDHGAIEKEAHSQGHQWIHVIWGKYDGRCEVISRSARAQMEANYHADEFWLVDAVKYDDGGYAVQYSTRFQGYLYVTSLHLCEAAIKQNVGT